MPPYLSSCVCYPSLLFIPELQQETALHWTCALSVAEPLRIALNPMFQVPCFSIFGWGPNDMPPRRPQSDLRNLFVILTSVVSLIPNTPLRPMQTDPSRAQIAASHAIPTLCEARQIRWWVLSAVCHAAREFRWGNVGRKSVGPFGPHLAAVSSD